MKFVFHYYSPDLSTEELGKLVFKLTLLGYISLTRAYCHVPMAMWVYSAVHCTWLLLSNCHSFYSVYWNRYGVARPWPGQGYNVNCSDHSLISECRARHDDIIMNMKTSIQWFIPMTLILCFLCFIVYRKYFKPWSIFDKGESNLRMKHWLKDGLQWLKLLIPDNNSSDGRSRGEKTGDEGLQVLKKLCTY